MSQETQVFRVEGFEDEYHFELHFTPDVKEQIAAKLAEWIKQHGAISGEIIMQDDNCMIYAPVLISDLVDNIIKPAEVKGPIPNPVGA